MSKTKPKRQHAKKTQIDPSTIAALPLTTKEGDQIFVARTSRRIERGTLLRLDYEGLRLVLRIADEDILAERY
ncbi:hypothetical protein [Crateriforma conspicua]|uniref:Uncharacterized protein n=1 Tax=Crateriforma conspicua TaxID=2527996 RepID=A0A5C6FDZ9_9PLAN|nr:hypothetical protein [Crateriforma conspicua]TWU59710.1 hypothetical protein V7x_54840 [Crateriforma conspicua]